MVCYGYPRKEVRTPGCPRYGELGISLCAFPRRIDDSSSRHCFMWETQIPSRHLESSSRSSTILAIFTLPPTVLHLSPWFFNFRSPAYRRTSSSPQSFTLHIFFFLGLVSPCIECVPPRIDRVSSCKLVPRFSDSLKRLQYVYFIHNLVQI